MGWIVIPMFVGLTALTPLGGDSYYYGHYTDYGPPVYNHTAYAAGYSYSPSYVGGTCPGCPPMGWGGPATYNPVGYGTPASPY